MYNGRTSVVSVCRCYESVFQINTSTSTLCGDFKERLHYQIQYITDMKSHYNCMKAEWGRRGGVEKPKFLHNKAWLKHTQIWMVVA